MHMRLDTECDSAHRRCVPRQESSLPWTKIVDESDDDLMEGEMNRKFIGILHILQIWNNLYFIDENEISNRTCPGGTQSCPDTYTCCAMVN